MNENEILNDKQFGFRAGHSAEHAILELSHQVSNAFDNNNSSMGNYQGRATIPKWSIPDFSNY